MSLPQFYTGCGRYLSAHHVGIHRLPVAVRCRLGSLPQREVALLDTAAEWCVLPPPISEALELASGGEGVPVRLSSRFGSFEGRLERAPVEFIAEAGTSLTIEATWFVSLDWPGPLVIGWKGCLERMCFALNPGEETFYFGPL